MERLSTRATMLEKYRTCKYRYKFEPTPNPMDEKFIFGSHMHKYCESQVNWVLNDELQWLILWRRPVKQRQMILNMADLVANQLQERWLAIVTSELTMQAYIEDADLVLEWTMDLLCKDKDWEYIIVDFKTAASARTEEHFEWVKQKIIYPALFEICYNKKIKAFEYWVMTKTSNPKLSVLTYTVEDNVIEQVNDISKELRNSTELGQRAPSYPNHSCFYCKLRNECKQYTVF